MDPDHFKETEVLHKMKGTMSFEDIYGAGSLDTLGAVGTTPAEAGQTQAAANPNTSERGGIMNLRGNLFGQPLVVWIALIGMLVVVKLLVEKEG